MRTTCLAIKSQQLNPIMFKTFDALPVT